MAKLSISKAAKEWGISRKTIQDAVKSGDLHTESGERNSKNVDTTDLLRVFGEPRTGHNTGENIGQYVSKNSSNQVIRNDMVDKLIAHLEDENKRLIERVEKQDLIIENKDLLIEKMTKQLSEISKPRKLLPWFK